MVSPEKWCHKLEQRMILPNRGIHWDDSSNGSQGCLVGGFNHLEKYESQWEGLSHPIYYGK